MTRTIPLRRTILQFSHIRLTLARTFMGLSSNFTQFARIVIYSRKILASQLRHAVRISHNRAQQEHVVT
jgi:hypothetical protein